MTDKALTLCFDAMEEAFAMGRPDLAHMLLLELRDLIAPPLGLAVINQTERSMIDSLRAVNSALQSPEGRTFLYWGETK